MSKAAFAHSHDGRASSSQLNRRWTSGISARAHLVIIATTLLLPILILAGVLAGFYVNAEQQRAVERTRLLARQVNMAIDREFAPKVSMLQALATSRLLDAGDFQGFRARAREIANAAGITVVLRAPAVPRELINTSALEGAEMEDADPDVLVFDQEVISTKGPVFSDLIKRPLREDWGIVIMVPVLRGSEVPYLLSVHLPASHVARVANQIQRDPGWFVLVLDRKDLAITRVPEHDRLVGRLAPSRWSSRSTAAEGIWRGLNPAGLPVFIYFVRSESTKWAVGASVPQAVLSAPLHNALGTLALLSTALLLVALALAFLTGSRLSRAIWSLNNAGAAVATGNRIEAVNTPVREVNEVGRVLSTAAQHAQGREARLRSILNTVPEALITIDQNGTIESFSRSAEVLFGYASEEVIGSNVKILMPSPDHEQHDGYLERYLLTGERRVIGVGRVVTARRKDGSLFRTEVAVGEVIVDEQHIFIGFLRDLTAREKIEQELRQAQKMEAVGQLTGGIAHDFNNLLTVITGNLEMLEAKIANPAQRELLSEAEEAVALGAQLTERLLAFGRRQPLNPKRVDVGQLVRDFSDLLRRILGETIELVTDIKIGPYESVIDPSQLQNAILNLAINARDAMPDAGTLFIEVGEAVLDVDYAKVHPEVRVGRYVCLAITDTGEGMAKGVRERAFEPFFTTKPPGSGTGLGLSMVYGFVKQSGGHVVIHSEPGQGTTVRLYLPYADQGAIVAAPPPATLAETFLGHGETVLVVEDDVRVRRVTTARLRTLGYTVLEAGAGSEALEILGRGNQADVLFTDIVMPGGMNGLDLADAVLARRPEMRVLFTSGYAEPEIVIRGRAHSSHWLRKPYAAGDLARKLREVLA